MVGNWFIVTVKVLPVLLQPLPLLTFSVPVYVPATTPAAMGTVIGLAGNAEGPAFTSPAANAAAFQVMVYVVGALVTAVYIKELFWARAL